MDDVEGRQRAEDKDHLHLRRQLLPPVAQQAGRVRRHIGGASPGQRGGAEDRGGEVFGRRFLRVPNAEHRLRHQRQLRGSGPTHWYVCGSDGSFNSYPHDLLMLY